MSNEDYNEQLYAERMLAITCERIAERGVSSRFDQVLADLLQAKTHYILMLENAMLDS